MYIAIIFRGAMNLKKSKEAYKGVWREEREQEM